MYVHRSMYGMYIVYTCVVCISSTYVCVYVNVYVCLCMYVHRSMYGMYVHVWCVLVVHVKCIF